MTIQDPNTYKLLTPGPLTTSATVREEMLVDRCTWDKDYKEMTQEVRASLLELAHANATAFWFWSTALTPNACARFFPIITSRLNAWILLGTASPMLNRLSNS